MWLSVRLSDSLPQSHRQLSLFLSPNSGVSGVFGGDTFSRGDGGVETTEQEEKDFKVNSSPCLVAECAPLRWCINSLFKSYRLAATPLWGGVKGGKQWGGWRCCGAGRMGRQQEDDGEPLDFVSPLLKAFCTLHYCTMLSSGVTSWPLRCLCSVLFLLSESSRSPVSLSCCLSLFLSLRLSLSLRLLRLLFPLRSGFLRPTGNKGDKRVKICNLVELMRFYTTFRIKYQMRKIFLVPVQVQDKMPYIFIKLNDTIKQKPQTHSISRLFL